MDAVFSGLKRRSTVWLVVRAQFKSLHFYEYGGASVPFGMASLHIWKINAEIYLHVLVDPAHMLPSRLCFSRKDLTSFRKTIINCILHVFEKHGFVVEELTAVQSFLPNDFYLSIYLLIFTMVTHQMGHASFP